MSDIQRENGHVDIANKLIDSLMQTHLSGREWQVMMVIFRQTWGYCELKDGQKYKDKNGFWVKKKMDRISHSQFEKFTGINRRKIWNILNSLLNKNIIIKTITKKGDITVCNYGIQKDSSKWILSPKKGTVTKNGDRVSLKRGIDSITKKGVYKRKDTKETITKGKSDIFIEVWKKFKTMRIKIKKPMTEYAEELIIKELNKLSDKEEGQIDILKKSIINNWQGVYNKKKNNFPEDNMPILK